MERLREVVTDYYFTSTGSGGLVIIIHYYNNADEAFVCVWAGRKRNNEYN